MGSHGGTRMAGRPPRALESDVLRAALELFCQRGPDMPLKELGERVGVTASALTQRFGSKRELIKRALETATLCPSSTINSLGGLDFPEALARLGNVFALYLIEHVLPAIELSSRLPMSPNGAQQELSTQPAIQGFIDAATRLIPSGAQPRKQAPRLFQAYLATLVGEYQLTRSAGTQTFDPHTRAQALARDFTPLLMEPTSQTGA